MKKKSILLSMLLSVCMVVNPCQQMAPAEAAEEGKITRVSVHDPSIIRAGDTYYVFGSHMADAKSTDMIHWTQINKDWNARETEDAWQHDSIYGDVLTNFAESFRWAGYDDADCSDGRLAVWAPDVKYNPYYEWEDGSKGAYMMYYSASSTYYRSCIGYAVAKEVEGPYQYKDTVIYSGFSTEENTDKSDRDIKWDHDYLNLKKLIDDGIIEGLSDNWFRGGEYYNTKYAPNAIDPTVFFDKNGEMYMLYGSWSGGLFILNLDKKTGAVNYPGKDSVEPISQSVTDRYFGTRIAGGNGVSGEGGYIIYDEKADYYYLYETYGSLQAKGGYNMRLYRSKNVYGPYEDAKGGYAKDNAVDLDNYGIKLIGNYQFTGEPGYRAAGHNSALIDEDGQHYLVYHQRFNEPKNQTERHEVRVHKQFLNEDLWPVTAVYENHGETIAHYRDRDVMGTYEIVDHGRTSSGSMLDTEKITLHKDGSISGDRTGSWKKTSSSEDYDYVTLVLEEDTYKGVFFKQYNEKSDSEEVMTFSTIGKDNCCVWGTWIEALSTEELPDEPEQPTPTPAATAVPILTPEPTVPTATASPLPTQMPSPKLSPTPVAASTPAAVPDTTAAPQKIVQGSKIKLKRPALSAKYKKGKIVLNWKKGKGEQTYELQYKTGKKWKKTKKKTFAKLKRNKVYSFRLRVCRVVNGKKNYSAWSKVRKIKVK